MIQRIICGDNLEVMKSHADESVDLIILDPPFFTNEQWEIIFNDGAEIRSFNDRWITDKKSSESKPTRSSKDINVYLEFMEKRLRETYRILKKTGSFYLHCDYHADSYLRVLCDKIFGHNPNDVIVWKRTSQGKSTEKSYGNLTDTLLYYNKSETYTFNKQYYMPSTIVLDRDYKNIETETGRKFCHHPMFLKGNAPKSIQFIDKGLIVAPDNQRFAWNQETYDRKIAENPFVIYWTKTNSPRIKTYADEYKGTPVSNLWDDIYALSPRSAEALGYPTQKPEALLERIIKTSSNEGDIVFDCFCGCGTSIAVAKRLKRQFIGIDVSPTACRLIAKRVGLLIQSIEGLPINPEEIALLDGNEFQNFIIREFGGFSGQRGADGGIDGHLGDLLIQVKKFKAGRMHLDTFSGMLFREQQTEGIFIALEYSKDFRAEVARLKAENNIIIHYFDVADIMAKKHYELVDKHIPKRGLDKYQAFKPEK